MDNIPTGTLQLDILIGKCQQLNDDIIDCEIMIERYENILSNKKFLFEQIKHQRDVLANSMESSLARLKND